jgi:hypothetical protein
MIAPIVLAWYKEYQADPLYPFHIPHAAQVDLVRRLEASQPTVDLTALEILPEHMRAVCADVLRSLVRVETSKLRLEIEQLRRELSETKAALPQPEDLISAPL